jgi:hypothetical protein
MELTPELAARIAQAPAIDPDLPVQEGTVPFKVGEETYETWYRLCGRVDGATEPPLVVLHGGPGMCSALSCQPR